MLEAYLRFLFRHPRLLSALCVSIVAVLCFGLPRLEMTNDFRVYFSRKNPQLQAWERMEEEFGFEDHLFFLVVPDSGDVFTHRAMSALHELTQLGWTLPYSRRVNSPANYQYVSAEEDALSVEDLFPPRDYLDSVPPSQIRNRALSEDLLVHRLLAPDGQAAGVDVVVDLPEGNVQAGDTVLTAARRALEEIRPRYPGLTIHLGGGLTANVSLREAVEADLRTLVLASYLLLILGLFVFLRSFSGTLATVLVITFSVASVFGLYGWMGYLLTPVSGWVPSVVMTISVADAVHILTSFYYHLREGKTKDLALAEALRINARPVFVTSLTTIIGVLCLNFSDSPPYRSLGNMVALGVAAAYVFSMSFLPALMLLLKVPRRPMRLVSHGRMDALAAWIAVHRRGLLAGTGLAVLALGSGLLRNRLTDSWHEYFDRHYPVRRALDASARHLGGVDGVEFRLPAGEENGIYGPEYLHKVDAFARWLRSRPSTVFVDAFPDLVKRLNKSLHGDSAVHHRVPDNRDLIAQEVLLYELSLPPGQGLDHTLNLDRSASRMLVLLKKMGSDDLIRYEGDARAWLAEHVPEWQGVEGTGLDMVFAHIQQRNIKSLIRGTLSAMVLISLVLVVALRSWKLGLVALVPNLIPAALAYGLWGHLNGEVGLALSVVMCMSLGVVVDDTVHFLSKYQSARRNLGMSVEDSLRFAFHTVGTAIVITSVVLAAGFAVLGLSHFQPTWQTGTLLAVTIAFALLADFFFLPPLILVLSRRLGL